MRRLLVVFLTAFLALPLAAASPTPSISKPSVIVFPFTANGSTIDREASSRLATIIATQMATTNLISVVPPPPGTDRKDYLAVARSNNCDYYISGFISGLGNGVSVVEQVVSTASGIVVFSNTAQLQTYADAAGQGDDLATFVSRHANRAYASIGTPPPASSPSPQPSAEAQANLGKLFGRRKKAAPAAKPTPAPTPAALVNATPSPVPHIGPTLSPTMPKATVASALPATAPTSAAASTVAAAPAGAAGTPASVALTGKSAGIAVLPVGGSAEAALRTAAAQRVADRTHADRAETATAACGARARDAVLAGSLAIKPDATNGGASATFELVATNCQGKTLWSRSFTSDAPGAQGAQLAMERAVDAALGAYLTPPKRRHLL